METNDLIFNKISAKNREQLVNFFDKLIDMYYDIMKIIISGGRNNSILYYDVLVEYANNNDEKKILSKIDCLVKTKDAIKYNVNSNLLIDSLILSIGG